MFLLDHDGHDLDLDLYIMDLFEDSATAPVYLVTDRHDDPGHATDAETIISETSSGRTMSTLGSSEVAEYFKTVYGFQYTSDENVPIIFPTDSITERVDFLYNIIVKLLQGDKNVPAVADEFLQRGGVNGSSARVLDLATSSGAWVQEMAHTYPAVEFVSLDVKPLTTLAPHPRIDYQVYDVYAGIAEPDASFDLVQLRQCISLTKDYNFLLREAHRVLKPGGMIIVGEMPSQAFEADNPSVVVHSCPRRIEAIKLIRIAQTHQGIDLAAFDEMTSRLGPGHPMWNNHHSDDKDARPAVRGFHTIISCAYAIPGGPWSTDQQQKIIGGLARVMFEQTWKALLPIMQIMGYGKADAEAFVDRLMEEFRDPRYRSCAKYKVWCARKI